MVSFDNSFKRDTPILRMTTGKVPMAKWVLWPIYAWHVVAPMPTERHLNMFQSATLRLSRAGVYTTAEISDSLQISIDLAALVVSELQTMDLIDFRGAPTSRGLKILDEIEEEPTDEDRVGYVFSDPFTGKLWPNFLPGDLPLAEYEMSDNGWPILLSGSVGDPWKDRTYSIPVSPLESVIVSKPSPHDIISAVQRNRNKSYSEDQFDLVAESQIKRVELVSDNPIPYQIALRLRRHESGDWMVDDPFGHDEDRALRRRIEQRMDDLPKLREYIAPLIGLDFGDPSLEQLHFQAVSDVRSRLTLAIEQYPSLEERLVAMQRTALEAELFDAPRDKWDDVLVKAQRAVEHALNTFYAIRPPQRPQVPNKLARRDEKTNSRTFNEISRMLGYTTPLPHSLTYVKWGKINSAERYGSGGLRPLLLLCLLAAEDDASHPLRFASARYPDLLKRLDSLALARDKAAHDNETSAPRYIKEHIETVYQTVVSLLFNSPDLI